MTESLISIGANAYHFGNAVGMREMLEKMPRSVLVMGNVDPAGEFRLGTPKSITQATLNLMNECRDFSNFVVSSGCDIPPESPWENVDAFFNAVDTFYEK